MQGSKPPNKRETAFLDALGELGCICCWIRLRKRVETERDHRNVGGHAGNKRMGHLFALALCIWHHRGVPHEGWSHDRSRQEMGPNQFDQKRAFLAEFGTFDELQVIQQEMLEQAGLWREEWNP